MVKDKRKAGKKWKIARNPINKNILYHKTQQPRKEM